MNMLGATLRTFRLERNLTQVDLAERSGVPQSTISRIERGEYKEVAPPEILNALAVALAVDPLTLLEAIGYAIVAPEREAVDPNRQALIDRLMRVALRDDRYDLLESILDRYIRLDRKAAEAVEHPADEGHHDRIVRAK